MKKTESEAQTKSFRLNAAKLVYSLAKARELAVNETSFGSMTSEPITGDKETAVSNAFSTGVAIGDASQLTAVKIRTLELWITQGTYQRRRTKSQTTLTVNDVMDIISKNQPAINGWMTLNEASAKYKVRVNTIKNWCANKVIRSEKDILGRIRINPADYDKLENLCHSLNTINDVILVDGKNHYSLSKTAADYTINSGISPDLTTFSKAVQRRYKTLEAILRRRCVSAFSFIVARKGRKIRIYIPEAVYTIFVNMVSISEAAKMCQVSTHTIRKWMPKKGIRIYKPKGMEAFVLRYRLEPIWLGCIQTRLEQKKAG